MASFLSNRHCYDIVKYHNNMIDIVKFQMKQQNQFNHEFINPNSNDNKECKVILRYF